MRRHLDKSTNPLEIKKIQEGELIYEMSDEVYRLVCDLFEQHKKIGQELAMKELYAELPEELQEKIIIKRD